MTFPRIFSRDHATRVEAEHLRRENEALRSALSATAMERDHYKVENSRFLDLVQSRNLAILRLTEECTKLHREAISSEQARRHDGRFCKKNCMP